MEKLNHKAQPILSDHTDYVDKNMSEQESDSNHMYKAWSFMKEGKQFEAFIEAKNVSTSDPFFYDAKVLCGEIKTSMKDYETAEQYLDEAIALKPDTPTAYMRRAWLRCSQKQPDLGLNDINKAETLIELLDNSLVDDWIITGIEEAKEALLKQLEPPQTSIYTEEKFLGKLIRSEFISQAELQDISTYDLGCEILKRLQSQENHQYLFQDDVNLFSTLEKLLNQRLEVFENRFSLTWLQRQFFASYHRWKTLKIPVKDATYVEIGSGAINPFSFMFLYLMLGAKKCFCLEPDSLVNKPLILRNLAETVGKFIINPEEVIGDYPITKEEILENISSFKLNALLKGQDEGLDSEKLVYLQESLFNNSISDNTADVLITVSVLEHLPDLDETLQEMARITKTGGYGLHNIDGIDHEYYRDSNIHPLQFLRVDTEANIVGVCNRIRPMNFLEIFERNNFEVLEICPYGKIEVSQERRNSFVEPFRSMSQECLEVTQAYFLVRKK